MRSLFVAYPSSSAANNSPSHAPTPFLALFSYPPMLCLLLVEDVPSRCVSSCPSEIRRLQPAYASCSAANGSSFHALTLFPDLFSCGGRRLLLCLFPGDDVLSSQISSLS
ncbi:hypothetical protein SRHO_G00032110 [Serrasalmus rhombeus]